MSARVNTARVNKWDWNHSSQSGDYFIKCRNQLIDRCLNHTSNWRRLTGIPLTAAYSILSLVELVSLVGEQTIKGIGNLLGAAIPRSQFKAKKGAKQLFLLMPKNILVIIFSPIVISLGLVFMPPLIAINPDEVRRNLIGLTRNQKKETF